MFEIVGGGCPLRGAPGLVKSKLVERTMRKKIDLAEVRALQNGACRRPVKAPWVRPPRRRVGPDSRDAPRRMGSPRSTDRRSSPQSRQRPIADGKSTSDRRKELGPKSGDVPRQSGEDGAQKNLKRTREVENGASHNALDGGHLFVERVNRRDRASSFWDMSDPDLGWSMGKILIGDHDVLHLLPQPTESLTHALAWNACQVLSLASTFQLREERSRNSESKLHEEIAMLREELLKKQKESDEKSKSCETLRVNTFSIQLSGAQKNLKISREVENGASHNASGGGHLFVEGVNRRDRAGSFWDMSDPDLGWSMGKTLIGDHDVLHLLPQPTESLTHALAWNACQVLSLASTFQLREERSRNSESKLHEEIAMLREELLKKQKESDEKSKSCETLRVELEEKSKSYEALRQELRQLEEKYSLELTTGEHFLDSAEGKTLLTSTGEKAVEGYRASSAFRDEVLQQALTIHDQVVIDCRRQLRETKLVSEDIVRMIEPSVPEPGDEHHEELLGTLDEILGDIDDDEMIEALRQNPI
ncbi:hypothetical protein F511_16800 [Dorcoceras hygrometricum]|uniref:Uncharacterized protein n=1 Tax=Dorcoceras hygrometricum TaxID=472368 RepID=A0A2Z7CV24_9LAMI|nr:hypothetical protein F511_16800 [Dorcoceras hygrometricum]